MEEWRLLNNGFYEVSSLGRVRRAIPGRRTFSGKLLRIQRSNKYPHVILGLGSGRKKQISVHRLVAEAFMGQCPKGMVVNHKDLNKLNYRADNLEYVTPRENREHARANKAYPQGQSHPTAKLTFRNVGVIRSSAASNGELALKFGVAKSTIAQVRRGHSWRGL